MPLVALDTIKLHLRVDNALEDSLISLYNLAAEDQVQAYCGRIFTSPAPGSVQAAILLFCGEFYQNREIYVDGRIAENTTAYNLLAQYRSYLTPVEALLPESMPLDNEPIFKGADFTRQWQWKDANGVAINVTGHTPRFEILRGTAIIFTASNTQITIGDFVNGVYNLAIPASVTSTFIDTQQLQRTSLQPLLPFYYKSNVWYRLRTASASGFVSEVDRKAIAITE